MSVYRFWAWNKKRFKRISCGYKSKDKMKLFYIALLQSIPNTFLKNNEAIRNEIEGAVDRLCSGTIVRVGKCLYSVLDRESLEIVFPDFETFMQAWFDPKKGEVVADVGAHIGKYVISSAKTVGNSGSVLAIEPNPVNYRTLEKNVWLNCLLNVVPINLAAWNADSKIRFFVGSSTARYSAKYDVGRGYIEVDARALDGVLIGLHRLDWMMIDVEGAEYEVLCGLEETLSKYRPKIIIEVFFKNTGKVKTILEKHEYGLVKIARLQEHDVDYFYCVPEKYE